MKQFSNQWILLIILVVSIVLRFFNFSEIPFTHDEFSALDRLDFDSFSALIHQGVKIDGHPAGVQVFLFYWTKIFGFSEEAIKFPFVIFGILSVYLTYLIGKRWFNETVGLLSAATVSCLQFTVMFSQIARPYISGLLFSLLMVYYLTRLIQQPEKKFWRNGFLFVIASTLCAYNHHFSLLFAAIVGISGAFFIKKQFLWRYVLLGLGIFILYIPHLSIFFYQLNLGGIEAWLAKPEPDFVLHFISYIFNHSWIFISTILLIALGFVVNKKAVSINFKYHLLFLIWFLLPLGIGYFYSTYFTAVLHYPVLIFSFTYLLFLIYGHLPNCKPKTNLILVLLVLIVGCSSLIFERQHYRYFYQSPYKKALEDYQEIRKKDGNVLAVIQSVRHINVYYDTKLKVDTNYFYVDDFSSIGAFKSFIESKTPAHKQLYLAGMHNMNPLIIPIVQEHYPHIEKQNNYFGGTTYLFTKKKDTSVILSHLDFENEITENWVYHASFIIDSSAFTDQKSYWLSANEEWGPGYKNDLKQITSLDYPFVDVSLKLKSEKQYTGAVLVFNLIHEGESIFWSGFELDDQTIKDYGISEWRNFYGSIKLQQEHFKMKNAQLKVYIWNKNKIEMLIDDFVISHRQGNPIIYGLMNKFP